MKAETKLAICSVVLGLAIIAEIPFGGTAVVLALVAAFCACACMTILDDIP